MRRAGCYAERVSKRGIIQDPFISFNQNFPQNADSLRYEIKPEVFNEFKSRGNVPVSSDW
jgi:hypothetical protein